MANPALSEKRFKEVREEDAGWASPAAAAGLDTAAATGPGGSGPGNTAASGGVAVPRPGTKLMTANGTFAKTFFLFLFVLAGGAFGWSQVTPAPGNVQNFQQVDFPGWIWIAAIAAFLVALVCIFRPKASPIAGPIYAVLEGVFLGAISALFELNWNGIVFQAILATAATFFVTLALYVFGIVKVTRRMQMIVIGATLGIVVMYLMALMLSLFGVDVTFLNDSSPLSIGISVLVCGIAAFNLFLDYEFIRQATAAGSPKYMEWYGAFGIMLTLVWLYLEFLRLFAKLRS
ncbi:MAG: Bax inhibitor-1/YccA family protein [Acidimicrobiia bacterium]